MSLKREIPSLVRHFKRLDSQAEETSNDIKMLLNSYYRENDIHFVILEAWKVQGKNAPASYNMEVLIDGYKYLISVESMDEHVEGA